MWKLILIFFVSGEVQESPVDFGTLEQCAEYVARLPEPPVGYGLACVHLPPPDERDA
jgi:hypothetical protein